MAKQSQSTSTGETSSFDGSLNEDINDFHLKSNQWTQARNAINNSKTGDLGKLGNEPATLFCAKTPYTVIGGIHLQAEMWLMFSTNNTDSEIGIFIQDVCSYTKLVNDPCLNFSTKDLIKGTSKPSGDCTIDAYWDDSRNPTGFIRVNLHTPHDLYVPYVQTCVDSNGGLPGGCITCTNNIPLQLDCEKIRLTPLVNAPCFRVEKGVNGGTMLNGSYFVVAAYLVNGIKVTDYYTPSNVQSLFDHDNVAGSLDIFVESTDDRFEEYELVLVSTINQQTVARKLGIYSVIQTKITLDMINNTWITIPIEQIPLLNAVVEKADAMFSVADYLIRVGPYNKLDFNYQPFANQIVTKWQSVEYPADYYRKGGHNTGYLRDEVYALFIRWVYATGDKSADYHIPGRAPMPDSLVGNLYDTDLYYTLDSLTGDTMLFETVNTASLDPLFPFPNTVLNDGGIVKAQGYMGYWESSEFYPDDKPQIWNSVNNPFLIFSPTQNYNITNPPYLGSLINSYDLCGMPIRHHKMPDNAIHPNANHFDVGGNHIRILGLAFENIKPPLDNQGNIIPGIVGYEILRGSRQGNRSIIAKGIINNMGTYNISNISSTRTGAYQNYPYNDTNPDPFLSTTQTKLNGSGIFEVGGIVSQITPQSAFSDNIFSFHSPDTNFTHPFLSVKEIKSYGGYYGTTLGKFEHSEKHPREKLVTNLAFGVSLIAGLGAAVLEMMGERKTNFVYPYTPGYSFSGPAGNAPGLNAVAGAAAITAITATQVTKDVLELSGARLALAILGINFDNPFNTTISGETLASAGYLAGGVTNIEQTDGKLSTLGVFGIINAVPTFFYYLSEGTDAALRLIKNILRYRNFDLKYNSHCLYDTFISPVINENRKQILHGNYIGPNIQDIGTTYRINNEFRNNYVAIEVVGNFHPIVKHDNTRQTSTSVISGNAGNSKIDPTKNSFNTYSTCAYVGLKQRISNQYGQLNSILQMPVTTCIQYINRVTIPNLPIFIGSSPVMFNGDIYIGRYTEKTTFFYFYEWLFDQPDGYEFDYLKHRMLLYPTYWANFESFETQDFTSSVMGNVITLNNWIKPSDMYCLDGLPPPYVGYQFAVKNAWFYLFNSGVRDFFVESEINIDQRDWGMTDSERHYDPYAYTTEKSLFETSIIKSGNYYKYDQSLSVSKTFINYISWGQLQLIAYDPYLADTCYQHEPKRLIYSLPANYESKKDYWRIFLPLNYKDFTAQVTCIKAINKTGALILFDTASPVEFQGSEELQTGLGTKLTIGDGKLFQKTLQSVANADDSYEYASCQNRLSVISTPAGVYWMSENQGKLFQLTGTALTEVSTNDLKWWFATYLPYMLTLDFPDFDLTDNPVSGIGCQAIYDNENSLIYFCKKDYVLRKDILDVITYDLGNQTFMVNNMAPIEVGDPRYFIDASWTISYDPKTKGFVGYHDWHPELLFPTKNTFMSNSKKGIDPNVPTNDRTNGIWIHNERCDLYCNYYGIDYPFEVEFTVNTGQEINTLRSIEYIMEVYKYAPNCYDRYHVLNENFDEAVVYNTEQCSGLLKLDLTPRNDLPLMLQYPKVNLTNIQILYSKVENKYRFNQFNDITRERGGQDVGIPGIPAYAEQTIFNTAPNGYVRILNANNLNYNKNSLQLKKFRGYKNIVLLRKLVSGDRKILTMIADTKLLNSPR